MIYRFFKRLFDVICAFIGIVGTLAYLDYFNYPD